MALYLLSIQNVVKIYNCDLGLGFKFIYIYRSLCVLDELLQLIWLLSSGLRLNLIQLKSGNKYFCAPTTNNNPYQFYKKWHYGIYEGFSEMIMKCWNQHNLICLPFFQGSNFFDINTMLQFILCDLWYVWSHYCMCNEMKSTLKLLHRERLRCAWM